MPTALATDPVLQEALSGLTAPRKTLSPWLFYDERGSQLFDRITELPEYYLTRTERAIFTAHAQALVEQMDGPVTIAELGAGSAGKTGILLRAFAAAQPEVLYQPIDISASALDDAVASITGSIGRVQVAPQVGNYITDGYTVARPEDHKVLALYIGSSIGNFAPLEAAGILRNLRDQLEPGDALLLGVDLAPSEHKPISVLLAAYDDAAGVTAAFNKNVLVRLNRELDADFDLDGFAHRARWNGPRSRMEMHLESLRAQTVHIAGRRIEFAAGETIHTENSHKFTERSIRGLLEETGFAVERVFLDAAQTFAVTLAVAVQRA